MATAHLEYHYEPEGWWADSPEYPGWAAAGASFNEVRLLAHEGLKFYTEDEDLEIVDPFSTLFLTPAATSGIEFDAAPHAILGGIIPLPDFRPEAEFNYSGDDALALV